MSLMSFGFESAILNAMSVLEPLKLNEYKVLNFLDMKQKIA